MISYLLIGFVVAILWDRKYNIIQKSNPRSITAIMGTMFGMFLSALIWPFLFLRLLTEK